MEGVTTPVLASEIHVGDIIEWWGRRGVVLETSIVQHKRRGGRRGGTRFAKWTLQWWEDKTTSEVVWYAAKRVQRLDCVEVESKDDSN